LGGAGRLRNLKRATIDAGNSHSCVIAQSFSAATKSSKRPLEEFSGEGLNSDEAEQQAQRLYRGGEIDFLPLLDAQRSLAAADSALAASHAQLAADQVAIFLDLGGGWES